MEDGMSVKRFFNDDGVELFVSPSFNGAGAMGVTVDVDDEVCPLWPTYPCKCHPRKGVIEPEKEDEWR
jgi:hypothetical protein